MSAVVLCNTLLCRWYMECRSASWHYDSWPPRTRLRTLAVYFKTLLKILRRHKNAA